MFLDNTSWFNVVFWATFSYFFYYYWPITSLFYSILTSPLLPSFYLKEESFFIYTFSYDYFFILLFTPEFFTGWILIFLDLILLDFYFSWFFLKFFMLESVSNLLFLVLSIWGLLVLIDFFSSGLVTLKTLLFDIFYWCKLFCAILRIGVFIIFYCPFSSYFSI